MKVQQSEREQLLRQWIQRSSAPEEERMDRAERMITRALENDEGLKKYLDNFEIFTKGSYANQTNVRSESDVDIAVNNDRLFYYEYLNNIQPDPSLTPIEPYRGPWGDDPQSWRRDVTRALKNYFGADEVDDSGEVAITIAERPGSRPSADVVPGFSYIRYDSPDRRLKEPGSKVFKKSGGSIINYPKQQLENGNTKDRWSQGRYKQFARALKNAENTLVKQQLMEAKPSYFMECLAYNVPNPVLTSSFTLSTSFQDVLIWLDEHLSRSYVYEEWLEPNELKYLFAAGNKWNVKDGLELVGKTWSYLEY